MKSTEFAPPGVPHPRKTLPGHGPLTVFRAGGRALRTVPGLRWLLLKGFVLLYSVFIAVGAVVLGLLYRYALAPMTGWLDLYALEGGVAADFLAPILTVLLWVAEALVLTATLVFALLLTLSLMSLWFEVLAGRIVTHLRGVEAHGTFTLAAWLGSLGRSLRDSMRLLILSLLTVLLAFVPVAGPLLVLVLSTYLLGWEVREPYLAARAAYGEQPRALRKGLLWWTLRVGLLPVLLAMVPWLGWLLLPVLLTWQVAGTAWIGEGGDG